VLALPPEPHYQQPVIWVPVAGGALAVGSLWPLRPAPAMAAALLAGAVGGWGLGLQQTWMEWIRNNGGTRGIHYGLPIGVQRQALAESCAVDAPAPAIALQTQLVIFSCRAWSRWRGTEPACQGRRVVVCGGPACPALPAGWAVATSATPMRRRPGWGRSVRFHAFLADSAELSRALCDGAEGFDSTLLSLVMGRGSRCARGRSPGRTPA
jgi:hypothetical protein